MLVSPILASLISIVQPQTFSMQLPVSPETPEGQRLVALRALELCAGQFPQLGRYRFAGDERVGASPRSPASFTILQELTCTDAPPEPPVGVSLPAGWQPSEADTHAATAATERYFAAVDSGDAAALDAMSSAGHREGTSAAERAARLATFRSEAGRPGQHRIVRVTWYVNPEGAAPGAYAAVDFERQYQNFSVSCGYVAWQRQGDGSLSLIREETGNAPREVPGVSMAEVRASLRCRD
jgi:hypothetical protein